MTSAATANRLRPALVLLSGKACGGLRPEHPVLAAAVEMVHTATLIHDDVLDEADIRRRAATVSRLWGNERAVLMSDFLEQGYGSVARRTRVEYKQQVHLGEDLEITTYLSNVRATSATRRWCSRNMPPLRAGRVRR